MRAFAWLVGPAEIAERDDGVRAAVKLKKCRYLEESGCAGSCVRFCKLPTEAFFKEAFGVDAWLAPDFEDGSCVMTFGVPAPAVADDESLLAPCQAKCARSCAGTTPTCPLVSELAEGAVPPR